MTPDVGLLSLATATPRFELRQEEVLATVLDRFAAKFPLVERLAPVFANAGIRTRQAIRPIGWYLEPRSWPERCQVYLDGALDLYVAAASQAL
ncbi:MAG: type III polyketide synthase, partial [Alphaproteobacteria bacterium]|nr:type III polyketide synthase [Alphaproteobacteria bacterium]